MSHVFLPLRSPNKDKGKEDKAEKKVVQAEMEAKIQEASTIIAFEWEGR